jgi:hypothetical protein
VQLVCLDQVFGLSPGAIDLLIECIGQARQIGDDEAAVGALGSGLDACDDAALDFPAGGGVAEVTVAADLVGLAGETAERGILGEMTDLAQQHRVAGEAEDIANALASNRVEAVLSLPGGVFQPYSGVKTSVLVFRKGGRTGQVMFLHADNDGFKLDANHDQLIEADDLPGLIAAFNSRDELWRDWKARDPAARWTEKWWFADAEAIEREDWNLSATRYRPESREAAEHRDPRELLAELRDEMAAILGDVESLAAELGEQAA